MPCIPTVAEFKEQQLLKMLEKLGSVKEYMFALGNSQISSCLNIV